MPDYGPSLKAARLYEKTSARGNAYLAGRWGALKVAVVKTQEVSETGEPIWQLLSSEAPKSDARPARTAASEASEGVRNSWQKRGPHGPARRETIGAADTCSSLDDSIPI